MKRNGMEPISAATKKRSKLPLILIGCFLLFLIIMGFVAANVIKQHRMEEARLKHLQEVDETINIDTFYRGISIEGIDLSGKTKEEAKEALKQIEPSLRDDIDITLTYGDKSYHYTEDDFAFTYNTDEILEEAYQFARSGDDETRFTQIKDLKDNPKNFEISAAMDSSNVNELVSKIAEEINIAPVDAHVVSFKPFSSPMFSYTDGTDGLEVDQEATAAKFNELLNGSKQGTAEVVTRVLPSTRVTEELKNQTQLLSSFSTVSTNSADGNHNMALALSKVNGTVLQPGQVFSYNRTIGNSTTAAGGWRKAGALLNGETVMEYGGGICQASTTVYGAALRADMEITTRYNHRWPSSYVPIGQDATVSYGSLDFCFRNNSGSPIYIWANMSGATLTVKFYGKPSNEWDSIEIVSQKTETVAAPETIYQDDPTLDAGTQKQKIQSRNGSRATATAVYYKNGQVVKRKALHSSYYRPVQGIVLVGSKPAPAPTPEPEAPATSSEAPETQEPATE